MVLAMSAMEIVGLATAIVGFIGALGALVPTVVKVVKLGKEIIKNKDWNKIKEIANAAMVAAEGEMNAGADKREAVIAAVENACLEANIPLDGDIIDDLIDYIDQFIGYHNDMTKAKKDLTKQQRAEKKAKEKEEC